MQTTDLTIPQKAYAILHRPGGQGGQTYSNGLVLHKGKRNRIDLRVFDSRRQKYVMKTGDRFEAWITNPFNNEVVAVFPLYIKRIARENEDPFDIVLMDFALSDVEKLGAGDYTMGIRYINESSDTDELLTTGHNGNSSISLEVRDGLLPSPRPTKVLDTSDFKLDRNAESQYGLPADWRWLSETVDGGSLHTIAIYPTANYEGRLYVEGTVEGTPLEEGSPSDWFSIELYEGQPRDDHGYYIEFVSRDVNVEKPLKQFQFTDGTGSGCYVKEMFADDAVFSWKDDNTIFRIADDTMLVNDVEYEIATLPAENRRDWNRIPGIRFTYGTPTAVKIGNRFIVEEDDFTFSEKMDVPKDTVILQSGIDYNVKTAPTTAKLRNEITGITWASGLDVTENIADGDAFTVNENADPKVKLNAFGTGAVIEMPKFGAGAVVSKVNGNTDRTRFLKNEYLIDVMQAMGTATLTQGEKYEITELTELPETTIMDIEWQGTGVTQGKAKIGTQFIVRGTNIMFNNATFGEGTVIKQVGTARRLNRLFTVKSNAPNQTLFHPNSPIHFTFKQKLAKIRFWYTIKGQTIYTSEQAKLDMSEHQRDYIEKIMIRS